MVVDSHRICAPRKLPQHCSALAGNGIGGCIPSLHRHSQHSLPREVEDAQHREEDLDDVDVDGHRGKDVLVGVELVLAPAH